MQNAVDYRVTDVEMMGRPAKLVGLQGDTYFADVLSHIPQNRLFIDMACRLRPDSVIVDVGANIGVTALIGSFCLQSGTVYAVEPSPRAFGCLQRMAELNGLENCQLINSALGEQPGKVSFLERDFLAGSHLGASTGEAGSMIEVDVTTLDLLVQHLDLRRVDLIKVDVEGFELDVLKGATRVIDEFAPQFVIEFNSYAISCNRRQSPVHLAEYILERFGSFSVERDGRFVTVSSGSELRDFIFSNMSSRGCIDDICFGLEQRAS